MRPSLQLRQVQRMGLLKVVAALEDPLVRLEGWTAEMPLLTVVEGGVELELEFVCVEAFRSFQRQVAAVQPLEDDHD